MAVSASRKGPSAWPCPAVHARIRRANPRPLKPRGSMVACLKLSHPPVTHLLPISQTVIATGISPKLASSLMDSVAIYSFPKGVWESSQTPMKSPAGLGSPKMAVALPQRRRSKLRPPRGSPLSTKSPAGRCVGPQRPR